MKRPSSAKLLALAPGAISMCVLSPLVDSPEHCQLELHLTPAGSARWSRRTPDGEQLREGIVSDVRRFADCIRVLIVHAHPAAGGHTYAAFPVTPH